MDTELEGIPFFFFSVDDSECYCLLSNVYARTHYFTFKMLIGVLLHGMFSLGESVALQSDRKKDDNVGESV